MRGLVPAAASFRKEAANDRITGLEAEVAFYAVLGIFPGLLALAASFRADLPGAVVAGVLWLVFSAGGPLPT